MESISGHSLCTHENGVHNIPFFVLYLCPSLCTYENGLPNIPFFLLYFVYAWQYIISSYVLIFNWFHNYTLKDFLMLDSQLASPLASYVLGLRMLCLVMLMMLFFILLESACWKFFCYSLMYYFKNLPFIGHWWLWYTYYMKQNEPKRIFHNNLLHYMLRDCFDKCKSLQVVGLLHKSCTIYICISISD